MPERPTIAFRVGESQKERWEEYADETDEYDSLSHLIRVSVAHEMSDEYGPQRDSSGGGDRQDVGEVLTELNRVHSRLDDLEDEITATREESRSVRRSTDVVTAKVLHALHPEEYNSLAFDEIYSTVVDESGPEWERETVWMVLQDMKDRGVVEEVNDGEYIRKPTEGENP